MKQSISIDQMVAKIQGHSIIRYKKFHDNVPSLKKDIGNAGYDLYACIDTPVEVQPGECIKIPLGIATEIPEGYAGLVLARSSTYIKKGLILANSVGLIDSSYRGDEDEWQAIFINITDSPVTVYPSEKLCQTIIIKLADVSFAEVDNLSNSNRGGFGSTGGYNNV